MTRARAKAIQLEVNSLLSTHDFDTPLDGMLLTTNTLCVIRYIPQEAPHGSQAIEEEENEGKEELAQIGATGRLAEIEPARRN